MHNLKEPFYFVYAKLDIVVSEKNFIESRLIRALLSKWYRACSLPFELDERVAESTSCLPPESIPAGPTTHESAAPPMSYSHTDGLRWNKTWVSAKLCPNRGSSNAFQVHQFSFNYILYCTQCTAFFSAQLEQNFLFLHLTSWWNKDLYTVGQSRLLGSI
jgi:hypothetical protein